MMQTLKLYFLEIISTFYKHLHDSLNEKVSQVLLRSY